MKDCAKWSPLVLRIVLGVTLILAGISKLMNPAGFVELITNMAPYLPSSLATAYGYALPYVELVVGVLTLVGLWTRYVAWVGALLFASFIIGVSAATPEVPFFLDPNATRIPNKDFAYLAMMISLGLTGAGMWSIDKKCKNC
ncbi:hypothetical protein COV82_02475 [Candidatus Peregrinibacteria bacterium CG11_big_fil_rev_8_21_14_0_20_46_8]|nr:MAG: hypothetical protein COV82_02475 [Candidatus Peregrinibacteria bacterium CG11_big_fil_rev_8_21_14_0_20_46_8]